MKKNESVSVGPPCRPASLFLLTVMLSVMYMAGACCAAQEADQANKGGPPSPSLFTQMRHALSGIPGNEAKVLRIDEFLASDSPHISALDKAEALLLKVRYLSDREEKAQAIDRAITYTDEATHRYLIWNIRAAAYLAKANLLVLRRDKAALLAEMIDRYGESPDIERHEFNRTLLLLKAESSGDFLEKQRLLRGSLPNISIYNRESRYSRELEFRREVAKADDVEVKKRLYDEYIDFLLQSRRYPEKIISLLLERANLEEDEAGKDKILDFAAGKLLTSGDCGSRNFERFLWEWITETPIAGEMERRLHKAVELFQRQELWIHLLRFLRQRHPFLHPIPGLETERDKIIAEFSRSEDPDIRWEIIQLKMARIRSIRDLAEKIAVYDELLSLDYLSLRQKVKVLIEKVGILPDKKEKSRLLDEIAEEIAASDNEEGPYCAAEIELEKIALLPVRQDRIACYREFIERFGGFPDNPMRSLSFQASFRLQDELRREVDSDPPPDMHTLPLPPMLPYSP